MSDYVEGECLENAVTCGNIKDRYDELVYLAKEVSRQNVYVSTSIFQCTWS